MRRIIFVIFTLLITTLTPAYSQLSESQIADYVTTAQAQGKTRQQVYAGLAARGVDIGQFEEMDEFSFFGDDIIEDESLSRLRPYGSFAVERTIRPASNIFGHNIFNQSNLTFEPSNNIPTPANYHLGPGDEVIIDVWGANQISLRQVISPEGSIMVSGIGPVYLNGLSVTEANSLLQREFSRIFSGIEGEESFINLTLGQIRTIQVNVMGEAVAPGTYALSSFATAFHALYRAGGVNGIGSLRNITVVRNNKKVADIDIYDYILSGSSTDFIRLQEGDVIIIPPYEKLVKITGKVKRPMFYEMKNNENLGQLLSYAGGFTGDAYSANVSLTRYNGIEKQLYTIEEPNYSAFILMDGDMVTVEAVLEQYENMVEIKGAVYRPGAYELNDQVNSVRTLIDRAQGLRGDEFAGRAIVTRERPDRSFEVIPLDLRSIVNGTTSDFPLRNNDILYIASIHDITEYRTISIDGAVAQPGTYPYVHNMTLEDFIINAGGLLESASIMKVDVARRSRDPRRTEQLDMISRTYSFSLKDGLVVDGESGFLLEPYDQVYVRFSPGYEPQRNVIIAGEILYSGKYALTKKAERLTDLIEKSGGLTSGAYPKGARLIRTMNAEERAVRDASIRVSRMGGRDSVAFSTLDLADTYTVGIELDKALAFPYSEYDMILREGDRLFVPEYINTVKINGEVLHSNVVSYREKQPLKYYISQAGGYSSKAKKRKVYVIHMNGTVSKYKNRRSIEPGSEIIVPSKSDRHRMSVAEILSISSAAASIGTMGAAIGTLAK